MDVTYAELDVTTNYSFLRGASHPDELVNRATELKYAAIAVTDRNSLAGVVRAHEAAKATGLKLIIGTRLTPLDGPEVLVWVPDRATYARLCRLLTLGKRRAEKDECELYLADVLEHAEGLWAGVVAPASPDGTWVEAVRTLKEGFGPRLSAATCWSYAAGERARVEALAELCKTVGVPLLATNGVLYHDPSRRRLQDVLTCVRHGCTIAEAGRRLQANAERYLKEPAEMVRRFLGYPQAIRRGVEIAGACKFSLEELRYEYPDELVPAGRAPAEYLAELTWAGAAKRYPGGVPETVRRQIEHELTLIAQLRYEAYFLTVHDLVTFARSRGILCQGRGSAANSAVCYCLEVTCVDPARGDALFERFVSAARNEPPDIDVDFEHERREEVLQYVYGKYGRERAGIAAEVITYRARSAVRDVGKALGLGLDLVDQMAKRMDMWNAAAPTARQLREMGLDPSDRTIRLVTELTGQLLGFPRHLSQHVGGMVMTRGPLCELVPIGNAAMPDRTVIEWDKDDIDTLGILKVDVLALGMLTCLSKCLKSLEPPLELHEVPPEDPAVYHMISDADTVGVFQIESRAQMAMLPRLRPKEFYDLVIEVAIVRPGPIQGNMVHPYLRRRNKEEPVEYPSEALKEVLSKTLGVPLFQEQAMRVAMVAAGFSAEEADRLRRAMAAWRRNGAIKEFRPRLIEGMVRNGYALEFAERCFEQIQGFGEYGFPESHAASFASLVYASAWLKRRHPAIFAAGLLNSQPMGFYAPAQIVRDAADHGVTVLPVDVNFSQWDCTLVGPPTPSDAGGPKRTWGKAGPKLRLGLRLIKGLHRAHADRLVEARRRQPADAFASVAEFHRATRLPRHTLERLAEADAFASTGVRRREALWEVLELTDGDAPLFDACPEDSSEELPLLPEMPHGQEVMTDYAMTGMSLKDHPVRLIRPELARRRILSAAQVARRQQGEWARVAGLVLIRQRPDTASGVVFVTLEDETGVCNLILRPDVYERFRLAARHAMLLQADGRVQRQGKVVHVMPDRLTDLSPMLDGYQLRSRDFH